MPTARFYRRCSHEGSRRSGLGLDEQARRIAAYYELLKVDQPELEKGKVYEDAAVSAWRYHFLKRKGGAAINLDSQRGDHIIFAELTRAFRNIKDAVTMLDHWLSRGVVVHFADLRIDLSTASGKLVYNVLSSVAQWEAEITSERNKAIVKMLREKGIAHGGYTPIGMKCIGKGKQKKYVANPEERTVMQEIVRLRDDQGLSWERIANELEWQFAAASARKPFSEWHGKRIWKKDRCIRAYRNEKQFQKEGR